MAALPGQRRRHILSHIREHGAVRVSELADELGVASETIRRDLKVLDVDGSLVRTHGGALLPSDAAGVGGGFNGSGSADLPPAVAVHEAPFDARSRVAAAEKAAIAAEALTLLEPHQTIALDGSTTAAALARRLPSFPLTVVTNSLSVTTLLASQQHQATIICTGGTLNVPLAIFDGVLADEALDRLSIDVAFFSCRGIDLDRGFSDATDAAARFKRRLAEVAKRSVVLADHTKFSDLGAVIFAGPSDVDLLLTDAEVVGDARASLERAGLEVRTVPMVRPDGAPTPRVGRG